MGHIIEFRRFMASWILGMGALVTSVAILSALDAPIRVMIYIPTLCLLLPIITFLVLQWVGHPTKRRGPGASGGERKKPGRREAAALRGT
ncbi:hypothetical protein GC173_07150 [bacterium]|nr:hypothetical protein [bacterium]